MSEDLFRELLIGSLHFVLAAITTVHILLNKKDVRAAIGWTGLVWFAPVFGPFFYLLFGINRIRRSASRMRQVRDVHTAERRAVVLEGEPRMVGDAVPDTLPDAWRPLANLTGSVSPEPLVAGNSVEPLLNGDAGYPAMLEAIRGASRSIAFATYIFDRGQVSAQFVDALADAVARGVEVRMLIDGLGARYSRPSMVRELRHRGIRVAQFLPSRVPLPHPYSNLRNHRKLLVVDGATGFVGGLNVRDACLLSVPSRLPTRDIHFRVQGPIVRQLQNTFVFDWRFTTGESLDGDIWFPAQLPAGRIIARGIADGPDETHEALLLTLLGALAQAKTSVQIVTPYFLPDPPLLDALRVTALRGVQVDIYLPAKGNLRLVHRAQQAQMYWLLQGGVRVHLTPEPFDHSKIMIVDNFWSLIGSANWDPRSIRLNFEYVVECYSAELAATLSDIVRTKIEGGRELARIELTKRSMFAKIRDGLAWLLQPYL